MSCIIVPAQNTEAILDVRVVQEIQTALTSLTWLEKVFGIAQVAEVKNAEGGIDRFPRVYSNISSTPKEYTDVRYDDTIKAQLFFEREGDFPFGQTDEQDEVTYSLAIVCWANLNKVDPGRTYDFSDLLCGAILKILKDDFRAYISNTRVDMRPESAYSKYTLSDVENRFITLPYTAFRISFEWTEFKSANCYAFTPIGGTPC